MTKTTASKNVDNGGYVVVSKVNPALVLCTDGEFHAKSMVGPGGYCAKVYRSAETALRNNPGRDVRAAA